MRDPGAFKRAMTREDDMSDLLDNSQKMYVEQCEEIERLSAENERQKRINTTLLEEHQRLNARHEGDKKVVQASEDCARKHQERAERLLDENSLKDDLLWAWLGCYQKNHAPDEWLVGDTRQAIKETPERVSTEHKQAWDRSHDKLQGAYEKLADTQSGNKDTRHRHITTGDVRKSLECTHPERTIAGGWTQCDVCGDKWQ